MNLTGKDGTVECGGVMLPITEWTVTLNTPEFGECNCLPTTEWTVTLNTPDLSKCNCFSGVYPVATMTILFPFDPQASILRGRRNKQERQRRGD